LPAPAPNAASMMCASGWRTAAARKPPKSLGRATDGGRAGWSVDCAFDATMVRTPIDTSKAALMKRGTTVAGKQEPAVLMRSAVRVAGGTSDTRSLRQQRDVVGRIVHGRDHPDGPKDLRSMRELPTRATVRPVMRCLLAPLLAGCTAVIPDDPQPRT